jgi:hypothetical protein
MPQVLSLDFSCGACNGQITPSQVFGKGGLDRETELLACIGQETVDFAAFVKKSHALADEMGISRNDNQIQMPILIRSRVVATMINAYMGENYEDQHH